LALMVDLVIVTELKEALMPLMATLRPPGT
jgi:hypothetical protein